MRKPKTYGIMTIIEESKLEEALKQDYADGYDKWPAGKHWFMVDERDRHFFRRRNPNPLDLDVMNKNSFGFRLRMEEVESAGLSIDEDYLDRSKSESMPTPVAAEFDEDGDLVDIWFR